MTDYELKVVFQGGFKVQRKTPPEQPAEFIQPCMFETDLETLGFTKTELHKLVEAERLEKLTTTYKGGWRNTYVLLPSTEGEKSNATA